MKNFLKKSWPFIILAVLSLILHFAFLSYPSQVVFDEVHFGKFVAAYSTGQYYFDIHPPLGKLMIAGFAKLTGVNPVFNFAKIGQALPAGAIFALRFLPALAGAFFVLFFSWLAYLVSRSKQAALIAGFLILLDNAFLVQSKFILIDAFLLCFEVLTLCFFFLSQRQKVFGLKWFAYLALTGLFAGLTVSIKWTGLAVIGIIGLILLAKIFSKKLALYLSLSAAIHPDVPNTDPEPTKWRLAKEAIGGSLFLLLISFLVYLIPFFIHFRLLPNSGSGDAFMSPAFQQELKYGRENVYRPLPFWQKFAELNVTMFTANAGITEKHPFSSRWYTWPLNSKPVYYWNQTDIPGHPGLQAKLYFSGNPILWPLAGIALACVLLLLIFSRKSRRQTEPIFFILIFAYLANLLPFIFIERTAFLYHYLPPAIYANLLLALCLARLWPKDKIVFLTIAFMLLAGFLIILPISYGLPLPQAGQIINFFN